MRRRELRRLIADVMLDFRYQRAKAMLNAKKGERKIPKRLSRHAEAEEVIIIVSTSKGQSKGVAQAMNRFRMKRAELA